MLESTLLLICNFFKRGKKAGDFVVSPFVKVRMTGLPRLPLTLPFFDANGDFAGVVSSGLDLNWLAHYFSDRELPAGSALTVSDREDTIILRVPETPNAIGSSVRPEYRWLATAPAPGTGEGVGVDGIRRIFAYIPATANPNRLTVSVGIGKDASLAPLREASFCGAVLALTLGLAVLAAFIGGRRLIRQPLQRLIATADRLAAGELDARTGIADLHSEIGHLAVVFDRMAARLAQRGQALRENEAGLRLATEAGRGRLLGRGPGEAAFDALLREDLAGRIALFDRAAAEAAGQLAARREAMGRVVDMRDALIAGTALSRRALVASRNIKHFDDLDSEVIDPWAAEDRRQLR